MRVSAHRESERGEESDGPDVGLKYETFASINVPTVAFTVWCDCGDRNFHRVDVAAAGMATGNLCPACGTSWTFRWWQHPHEDGLVGDAPRPARRMPRPPRGTPRKR